MHPSLLASVDNVYAVFEMVFPVVVSVAGDRKTHVLATVNTIQHTVNRILFARILLLLFFARWYIRELMNIATDEIKLYI